MSTFHKLVEPWLLEAGSDDLLGLRDQLIWLQRELYDDYEPNRYEAFDDRLSDWLLNLSNNDQRKDLFRLLSHLFYVGKQQFDSLCRAAFNDEITRWIIDDACLDITAQDIQIKLDERAGNTWFCPITDSMRINSFLKLNSLRGHDYRPDWRSLKEFGNATKVSNFVASERIERLVLLEDFVGSGNQMRNTVVWATTILPRLPILVVPLVCCPGAVQTAAVLTAAHSMVRFAPTLTLRPDLFLTPASQAGEPELFGRIRQIILGIRTRLGSFGSIPFGYEGTGALVALYSNCPDNTLPIIHQNTPTWSPLFSRVRRS